MEPKEKDSIGNWESLVDTALEIAGKRRDAMQRMKAAFERGDDTEALRIGKELCGLES